MPFFKIVTIFAALYLSHSILSVRLLLSAISSFILLRASTLVFKLALLSTSSIAFRTSALIFVITHLTDGSSVNIETLSNKIIISSTIVADFEPNTTLLTNLWAATVKTLPISSSSSLRFSEVLLTDQQQKNKQQQSLQQQKKPDQHTQNFLENLQQSIEAEQNQEKWLCSQMQFRAPAPSQDQLTRVIYTLLMPVVCVLGAIGAAICILVFTRRQMRSSLSIYLAGLSVFDFLLLLMSLMIYPSMNICMQEV